MSILLSPYSLKLNYFFHLQNEKSAAVVDEFGQVQIIHKFVT